MSRERPLVVVVENDPDVQVLLGSILSREGFALALACDGAQALTLLESVGAPAVIITELMMPVLDGFGFIREYHRRPGPHAPIVALSTMRAYVVMARRMAVAAALLKPVMPQRLIRIVRQLAEREPLAAEDRAEPAPRAATDELEVTRLRAILELQLEHPATEKSLRDFVDQAACYMGVPIALVSIITADRQYWTAACGIPEDLLRARGTPRHDAFCAHVVEGTSPLLVQNALENPVFAENVLVRTRRLRFYAGVPITVRNGATVGTLCLYDYEPHLFGHFDLQLLEVLARRAAGELEWRERKARPELADSAFLHLDEVDRELGIFGHRAFRDLVSAEAGRCAERRKAGACVVLSVAPPRLAPIAWALQACRPSFVGRLGRTRLGWLVPDIDPEAARAYAHELAGPQAVVESAAVGAYGSTHPSLLSELEMRLNAMTQG